LPEGFQSLDYELLEYVGKLPSPVTDRLAGELKARDTLVSHLRVSNNRLARITARAAAAAKRRRAGHNPVAAAAEAAEAVAEAEVAALQAEAEVESARSKRAMDRAHKLEREIMLVEETANAEFSRIAVRLEEAERCSAAKQPASNSSPIFEAQEESDDRGRLHEAQCHLHSLHERAVQLSRMREQAERRAQQREQELRLLQGDREQLRAEVQSFRAQTLGFERAERREEELRQSVKEMKSEFRRMSKADTNGLSEPSTIHRKPPRQPLHVQRPPATPSEVQVSSARSHSSAASTQGQGGKASQSRTRPATPQKKQPVERVARTLPVGGCDAGVAKCVPADTSSLAVLGQERSSTPLKTSPLRCAHRANSRSGMPLMSIPTPLRAIASMVR
jgi:myosin heavy subunit